MLKPACTDLFPPTAGEQQSRRPANWPPPHPAWWPRSPRGPGSRWWHARAVAAASIGQMENHIHPRNTAAAAIQPINTPYRHVPGSDTPTPTAIPMSSDTSSRTRAEAPRRRVGPPATSEPPTGIYPSARPDPGYGRRPLRPACPPAPTTRPGPPVATPNPDTAHNDHPFHRHATILPDIARNRSHQRDHRRSAGDCS